MSDKDADSLTKKSTLSKSSEVVPLARPPIYQLDLSENDFGRFDYVLVKSHHGMVFTVKVEKEDLPDDLWNEADDIEIEIDERGEFCGEILPISAEQFQKIVEKCFGSDERAPWIQHHHKGVCNATYSPNLI